MPCSPSMPPHPGMPRVSAMACHSDSLTTFGSTKAATVWPALIADTAKTPWPVGPTCARHAGATVVTLLTYPRGDGRAHRSRPPCRIVMGIVGLRDRVGRVAVVDGGAIMPGGSGMTRGVSMSMCLA